MYLQQRVMKIRTCIFFYKKFTRHKHTHTVCLDNKSWEEVLSDQWFLFIKREMSCPGTCAVPFLCDFYMTSPMGPPWLVLGPPCATPLKKILESPLHMSSDAKTSKCRLKFSSKMSIFFYQAPMFMFSYFTLMAMKRTYSLSLKWNYWTYT